MRPREVPHQRAGAAAPGVAAPKAAEPSHAASAQPARPSRPVKSTASSQPIYPGVVAPKGVPPVRPRGREPRPQHPTAARPVPVAGAAAAAGGVPSPRPPVPRVPAPPPRHAAPVEVPITRKITISEGISIKELSEKLEARARDVIKKLLDKGIFATINQTLDSPTATEVARAFGAEAFSRGSIP